MKSWWKRFRMKREKTKQIVQHTIECRRCWCSKVSSATKRKQPRRNTSTGNDVHFKCTNETAKASEGNEKKGEATSCRTIYTYMIRYIPIYLFIYFTLFVYSLRLAHTNTHMGLNIYICVCSFVDRIIHNNKTIRFHFIFSWTLFFHAFNSIQFVCILTAVHTLYKSKTETYERKKHQNTAFEWVNERASSRIVPGQEGKGMNKRKPVHFNVVAYYSLVRSSVSSFLICLVCLTWLG